MTSTAIEAGPTRRLNIESRLTALAKQIRRGIASVAVRRQRRRHVKELMALDDHLLADIGLRRGQIGYLAQYGHLPKIRDPDG